MTVGTIEWRRVQLHAVRIAAPQTLDMSLYVRATVTEQTSMIGGVYSYLPTSSALTEQRFPLSEHRTCRPVDYVRGAAARVG